MAVGQAVLSPTGGLSAWAAVSDRLEAGERVRSAQHGQQLQQALDLLQLARLEGLELSAPAELALLLRCSEHRAVELLIAAQFFAALPGGFAALAGGALTVEQSRTVVLVLEPVPIAVRVQVWRSLLAQLQVDADGGVVRPPQRLKELLARLILAADPDGAVQRKNDAAQDADVTYDRRGDGLVDLHAFGISSPAALAALRNLAARSQPAGSWDDRSAGRRRLDALLDLLLGRQPLHACDDHDGAGHGDADGYGDGGDGYRDRPGGCAAQGGCGCPPRGGAGPCGAQLVVHVPLATALGLSDVPAELVGHGPLHPDELSGLLLATPSLQAVFVDEHGTPLAAADQILIPDRGDPAAVRQALLRLAHLPPGERFARHPQDHPRPEPSPGSPPHAPPTAAAAPPPPEHDRHRHRSADPHTVLPADGVGLPRPDRATGTAAGQPHPAGQPGACRVRPRLRRFLLLRAPRCEWSGCGASAERCDLDHNTAWPHGPTCACNLGPLCRRHHRTKQTGWTKTRQPDGSIDWTSPHGRTWTATAQHPVPPGPTRPLPPVTRPAGSLSPAGLLEERLLADQADARWNGLTADPAWLSADPDHDPQADTDHHGQRISTGATTWDLDLRDPWAWTDIPL